MCGTMCNCNYSHRHLKSMLIVYKNVLSLSLARSLSPFSLTLPERCSHLTSSLVFSRSLSLNCPQHQTETVKPNWLLWGNRLHNFPSFTSFMLLSPCWHFCLMAFSVSHSKQTRIYPSHHSPSVSLPPSISLSLSLPLCLSSYLLVALCLNLPCVLFRYFRRRVRQ